ncbi:hypothetical protein I5Q96_15960 [Serratia marcescens]|nr:hypothetical protein [Serratia marcescens]MBH3042495.1 hypothetical protein [Serratia marcescens]HAU4289592.1 hypothetical protein [Serratia marcescens]HAU4321262.1 hypothetical protein [Serratia marcescens]HEI8723222.1 hypothetical protein [Serratia marcescens]
MREVKKDRIEAALEEQITTAKQRTRLLRVMQKSLGKEVKKMGLKGVPMVEIKQVIDAFICLGEIKE